MSDQSSPLGIESEEEECPFPFDDEELELW
jgi:hypothetical protein